MTNAANAQAALIRASLAGVPAGQDQGQPVACLSNEAIAHALELAAAGFGTVTFTANSRGASAFGLIEEPYHG